MRKGGTLYYLHSDHLGSTVLTTGANGVSQSNQQYAAGACPELVVGAAHGPAAAPYQQTIRTLAKNVMALA